MDVNIKLTGVEGIKEVLRKLPVELQDQALGTALRAGGKVIADRAKLAAPVRGTDEAKPMGKNATKGRLPGFLRAAVSVRTFGGRKARKVVVTVGQAFYGMFQEFGTRNQPARPWLRPAFDASAPQALEAIMKSLAKAVERAAVKLSRRRR